MDSILTTSIGLTVLAGRRLFTHGVLGQVP
jgi:hypothetical protein